MSKKIIFTLLVNVLTMQYLIAQKNYVDSCKVYATSFHSEYKIRMQAEYLIEIADTSFLLRNDIGNKLLKCIKQFQDTSLLKKRLNKYSIDCRLLFIFYNKNQSYMVQFGKGMMSFNNEVYQFNEKFLPKIAAIVPCLGKFLE